MDQPTILRLQASAWPRPAVLADATNLGLTRMADASTSPATASLPGMRDGTCARKPTAPAPPSARRLVRGRRRVQLGRLALPDRRNAASLIFAGGSATNLQVNSGFHPFTELVASNSDPTAILTVTAAVSPAIEGTYGNLGTGRIAADGTTYTVTGTVAQVNAALAGIVLKPADGLTTVPGIFRIETEEAEAHYDIRGRVSRSDPPSLRNSGLVRVREVCTCGDPGGTTENHAPWLKEHAMSLGNTCRPSTPDAQVGKRRPALARRKADSARPADAYPQSRGRPGHHPRRQASHPVLFAAGRVRSPFQNRGRGPRQIMSFHIRGDIPDLLSLHLVTMDYTLATILPSRVGRLYSPPGSASAPAVLARYIGRRCRVPRVDGRNRTAERRNPHCAPLL